MRVIRATLATLCVLAAALQTAGARAPEPPAEAAIIRAGMARYRHPQYQYECLGLGGTMMRAGPHGFTSPAAPGPRTDGYLRHAPYLAYQFWWDDSGHRHLPFDLIGGYGPAVEAGGVTAFAHRLEIATGILTIDLGLRVGGRAFRSRRELFITPGGVLVIRVTDGPGAPGPFRLRVDANRNVRVYLNAGVYDRPHDPWIGVRLSRRGGAVYVARRPHSCVATLAVAFPDPAASPVDGAAGAGRAGRSATLFIAPGSSYEGADPVASAWRRATEARRRGFQSARHETERWWRAFGAQSQIRIPDRLLARWYARSNYYMGVFFGRTDVPPGCNGVSIESFAGTVCPEEDLVLDQMALLYANHLDEARRVVGWLGRALPRAERYAREGLTLHKTSVKYRAGAKFGTLMGYDGVVPEPPTEGEGIWAYGDIGGNNAALMALSYVDWSGDERYGPLARRILRETTQVSVEDLQWRSDFGAYMDRHMPSAIQQAGTLYGLRESLRRGVAEPGWAEIARRTLLPTTDHRGRRVLAGGPGAPAAEGAGDTTWLVPVWWYRTLADTDALVRPSYDLFSRSRTGDYVFNNGWMGVFAAKLHDGAAARAWAARMIRPGVTVFDDSCFGEIISDFEDFKKTPEVAAHAALICNVTQMLMDPDDEACITLFPAIPAGWIRSGVAFRGLAARGGLRVSADIGPRRVSATLQNTLGRAVVRALRVRLPDGIWPARLPGGVRVAGGWAEVPAFRLPPHGSVTRAFCLPLPGSRRPR